MAATESIPNGSGAAAVVAAGAGWCVLGVLAVAADRLPWLAKGMIFYRPTGPLSGVTTIAVAVWLFLWMALDWRWRTRTVEMSRVRTAALVLLALGLLLTFPPFADML